MVVSRSALNDRIDQKEDCFMNLPRYIGILTLAFAFTTVAKAQQIAPTSDTAVELPSAPKTENRSDTAKSDDALDKNASTFVESNEKPVASESSSGHKRVNTDGLFANVHNPFENAVTKNESAAADPAPQTLNSDGWQFRFTPYLWIAGISGNAGIGNLSVKVDSGITDTNVHLSFGFMVPRCGMSRWSRCASHISITFAAILSNEPARTPMSSTRSGCSTGRFCSCLRRP